MKKVLLSCVILAFCGAARAETKDDKFRRLDRNGDGVLSPEEFLGGDLEAPAAAAAATPDQVTKEFKILDASRDGGISFEEFQKAVDGGRIILKEGESIQNAFRTLDSGADAGFIVGNEYRQARAAKTVTYQEVKDDVFTFQSENAAAQRKHTGLERIRSNVSVTASGLGDKKGKGPATVNWVRQRTIEAGVQENVYRWDIDAKIQSNLTGLLLDNDLPKWAPAVKGRAEARIIDYNSREADERPGALNHMRFGIGGQWAFSNLDLNATGPHAADQRLYLGSFVRLEGEYETDPTNDYRNITGLLQWEPVLSSWHPLRDKRYLAGLIQDPMLTVQPILALQYGRYFKEVANQVDVVPATKVVTKLGNGLESVSFLQQHSRVVTDEEISRAIFNLNASLRVNASLFINGEYKLVAELNGDNRAFHFGKVSVDYVLTPFSLQTDDGNGVTLSLAYLIGQDSPTFERTEVLTAGIGLEF